MIAVKARFDGKRVLLPEGVTLPPVGDVFVVFDLDDWRTEDPGHLVAVDEALAKAWDNPHDDIFNDMGRG